MELERTAVHLVQHAVGNGDVLGDAAAEPEDGPARAERGVRHGHEPAAPEERARVVLGLDVAAGDGDVLTADEVKAVVVAVDAVVDMQAVHVHVLALDHADAVIRALPQAQIADAHVLTAVEQDVVRPVVAAEPARRQRAARGRVELQSLAVD